MSPTTTLESTPPERKAPSGTSQTMCDSTASASTASQRPCRFVARAAERLRVANLPVLPDVDAPVTIAQVVARRQLAHALEDGPVARRVEEREVVIERPEIDVAVDRAGRDQRLDLGPEEQPAAALSA